MPFKKPQDIISTLLTAAASLTVIGVLTVTGATFKGDILPQQDSTYDLGATGNEFAEAHIDTLYVDDCEGDGCGAGGGLAIGGAVTDGDANTVLFVDSSGNLASDLDGSIAADSFVYGATADTLGVANVFINRDLSFGPNGTITGDNLTITGLGSLTSSLVVSSSGEIRFDTTGTDAIFTDGAGGGVFTFYNDDNEFGVSLDISGMTDDVTVTPPAASGILATVDAAETFTNKTLTSPVINVGSDATGDIYYRNSGGAFTRLGVGSDGQVLTLTSGLPSWAAAGSSGANAALSNLSSVAINTSLLPGSDDGAALGDATHRFSDLFLASGGVLNFDNGDATITDGTNTLTIAGANLLGDNGAASTPTYSFANDPDGGLYRSNSNTVAIAAGGTKLVEIENAGIGLFAPLWRQTTTGITASATQTQGQSAMTCEVCNVTTVATANNVVTLPGAVPGKCARVSNNGAETLKIFPASGDNLGAGVNTSTTLASGSNIEFCSYDTTNWEAF